ncbi:MAG: penicillin acylase family protein, partial [SAR324 cluster bacterium]|nr:penicillin acylase family protein [SAR324 cluster bacterium]
MKLFKRVLFGLIVILIIALGSGYFYLNGKKAVRSGELKLDGLQDKVEVIFDTWGVPHVTAQNQEDMFRAFGYVHAQDRLFQMELLKRLSQGRLAEILGEKLVKVDRLFRSLKIHQFSRQWAKELEKRSDPQIIRQIQAYLDGVNQFVKE